MQKFEQQDLIGSMKGNQQEYLEFLKVPSLSSGIYHLDAGTNDPQQPHEEDEIYLVLEGKASFVSGSETTIISKGTILFVEKNEVHKFVAITEDLTLLVFFAAN